MNKPWPEIIELLRRVMTRPEHRRTADQLSLDAARKAPQVSAWRKNP